MRSAKINIKSLGLQIKGGCGNPGLALERYLESHDKPESRAELLDNVAGMAVPDIYRHAYERWQNYLTALNNTQTRKMQVADRLIVGLGAESTLETAITMNRIYGVPVVPGSALKGLARSYYENVLKGKGDKNAEVLFGNNDSAGYVTWFDAWYVPVSGDRPLRLDVMTVHHPRYYSTEGKEPPSDFDDPNPISFVSAKGSFLVAVQGPTPKWSEFAMGLLVKALADSGVGGKTSSGYGRMIPVL